MLLIDGAKFEEWIPDSEERFENVFGEHAEDVFGKDAKYFDLKHKLMSRYGTGSIPDGYVIVLGNNPHVEIIEVELSSHPLQHIVTQIINITNGVDNSSTQREICDVIEDQINEDEFYSEIVLSSIKPKSIHRFLSDCFSGKKPQINIIIEKSLPQLTEAIDKIIPHHPIIEFRTFLRKNAEAVHAHLFDPIYSITPSMIKTPPETFKAVITSEDLPPKKNNSRFSLQSLLGSKNIHVNQEIFGDYQGITYTGKIVQNGEVWVDNLKKSFNSLSGAAIAVKKVESEDGWRWWYIKDKEGKKISFAELRKNHESGFFQS